MTKIAAKIKAFFSSLPPSTLFLVVVFVMLLSLLGFPELKRRLFKGDKAVGGIFFEKIFTESDLDRIIFVRKDTETILKKSGDRWLVNDHNTDKDKINKVFESFKDFRLGDLAGKSKESQETFSINDDSALKVTLKNDGHKEAEFFLGKSAASYDSFYIRKPNESEVYLAYGGLKNALDLEPDDFRDKTILKLDESKITGIKMRNGGTIFDLRKDSGWKLREAEISEEMVKSYLANVVNLTAMGFPKDDESFSFDYPDAEIAIFGEKDKLLAKLSLARESSKEEANYIVKKKGEKDLFKISAYVAQQILKPDFM